MIPDLVTCLRNNGLHHFSILAAVSSINHDTVSFMKIDWDSMTAQHITDIHSSICSKSRCLELKSKFRYLSTTV